MIFHRIRIAQKDSNVGANVYLLNQYVMENTTVSTERTKEFNAVINNFLDCIRKF